MMIKKMETLEINEEYEQDYNNNNVIFKDESNNNFNSLILLLDKKLKNITNYNNNDESYSELYDIIKLLRKCYMSNNRNHTLKYNTMQNDLRRQIVKIASEKRKAINDSRCNDALIETCKKRINVLTRELKQARDDNLHMRNHLKELNCYIIQLKKNV